MPLNPPDHTWSPRTETTAAEISISIRKGETMQALPSHSTNLFGKREPYVAIGIPVPIEPGFSRGLRPGPCSPDLMIGVRIEGGDPDNLAVSIRWHQWALPGGNATGEGSTSAKGERPQTGRPDVPSKARRTMHRRVFANTCTRPLLLMRNKHRLPAPNFHRRPQRSRHFDIQAPLALR